MKNIGKFILSLCLLAMVFFLLSCSTLDRQSSESFAVEEDGTAEKIKKTKEKGGKVKHYFIAVSPFSNLSDSESDNFIGFLIAEYLNSAMSSFPGITVIERERLYDIINEQKFQLSGLTDDESVVEVGNYLMQSKWW